MKKVPFTSCVREAHVRLVKKNKVCGSAIGSNSQELVDTQTLVAGCFCSFFLHERLMCMTQNIFWKTMLRKFNILNRASVLVWQNTKWATSFWVSTSFWESLSNILDHVNACASMHSLVKYTTLDSSFYPYTLCYLIGSIFPLLLKKTQFFLISLFLVWSELWTDSAKMTFYTTTVLLSYLCFMC